MKNTIQQFKELKCTLPIDKDGKIHMSINGLRNSRDGELSAVDVMLSSPQ